MSRVRSLILRALVISFAFCTSASSALGASDPGILLELDRESYRLLARDLATGEDGPAIYVAIGSPAYPTPLGEYRLHTVIHNPDWEPGETARRYGAQPIPASADGPLGIAKIPFSGAYALHGGGSRFTVGMPVSLGCLRATDESLASLIAWLNGLGALSAISETEGGERPQSFRRPTRLRIR